MFNTARHVLLAACCGWSAGAMAAEGFEIRYNIAGSLGGEIFAPPNQTGWAGGIALTQVEVNKVTGNDGGALSAVVPGGSVPLPASIPAALAPTYGANTARFNATGPMTRWDVALAYITEDKFGGGRLAFAVDIPYARKGQDVSASAATPALNWNPMVPAALRSAVEPQFNAQYQSGLKAEADAFHGRVAGMGDVELMAGWQYVGEQWRVLAGTTLVLPTGKYSAPGGPDIGVGNFLTLRPSVQVAWLPVPDIALAAKLSLGLNQRNEDNQVRSGNWAGLELAAGYKTAVGVAGLHAVRVQQYQDDDNNPWGASRLVSSNAGVFFTTLVPVIDAALTVQYMASTASRNAKHGTFAGVRLIKLF